jgi:iron complex outermembrane receptor protein
MSKLKIQNGRHLSTARENAGIYGFAEQGTYPALSVWRGGDFCFRDTKGKMKKIVLLTLFTCFIWLQDSFGADSAAKGRDQSKSAGYAAQPQKLDPIVVTASRVNNSWLMYPDSATLLASTRTVDVVDSKEIGLTGVRNITDVLKNQLGIDVKEYFGNGKAAQVDIRGFGEMAPSNVLVMIDGRRTNQVDLSGVDWLQIDLNSVERIEILRGSQSVLYGDNAVGGVINIITKRGAGKSPELGFGYETGSYHYNGYSGYSTAGTKFMDYYAGISSKRSNGYRGNSDLETDDFNANCTLRPTDYTSLRFDTGYHKDWYGQPGAVTDLQIERDGMRASDNPNDRGKTEDFYFMPGIDLRGIYDSTATVFSVDFPIRSRRTASVAVSAFGAWEQDSRIQSYGITPRLVIESALFGIQNRVVAGVDYYHYRDEISSGSFPKNSTIIQQNTLGLYIEDTVQATERVNITGGFRAEWADDDFNQEAVAIQKNNKRMFECAYDAGVNYVYNDASAVYANVSRSLRFPAVDEWYQTFYSGPWGGGGINLDLEPQTGMDYEIGIKDHSIKWLKAGADYFIMDTRHELFYGPTIGAFGANGIYDRTMRNGVEVEAHLLPIDDLDIYGKYAYIKAFFVGSHYAGNEIPMVPKHKVTGGVSYTFMDCLDISYIFNFVGPRRFLNDQLNIMRQMKQYCTSDIKITYRKHGMEIYGAINNALDYAYSDMGATGQYYPANGFNYTIGVKQKF